ncbi:MAG: hypothetical protein VB127_00735 [Sphaerochaeta sp.]|jgi:hypothetical protein|nr:hypothetical protein [Sphaerochaeta sp.]
MQSEIATISAPLMLLGLLAGFFLCFYGYLIKTLLVSLRSVLSGSLVFVTLSLLLRTRAGLVAALASENALPSLWALVFPLYDYQAVLIHLFSFALGGLLLFFLARRKGKILEMVVAIFTALSMDLILFLLILTLLPLKASLIISSVLGVIILSFCLARFESYMATESAIIGSLLVAYLLSRFWYLGFTLFFILASLLSFVGILNQMHMLKKRTEKKEAPHG